MENSLFRIYPGALRTRCGFRECPFGTGRTRVQVTHLQVENQGVLQSIPDRHTFKERMTGSLTRLGSSRKYLFRFGVSWTRTRHLYLEEPLAKIFAEAPLCPDFSQIHRKAPNPKNNAEQYENCRL